MFTKSCYEKVGRSARRARKIPRWKAGRKKFDSATRDFAMKSQDVLSGPAAEHYLTWNK